MEVQLNFDLRLEFQKCDRSKKDIQDKPGLETPRD